MARETPRSGAGVPGRITAGDGMRGLGALIVVLFHSALYFVLPVNPSGTHFGNVLGPLAGILEQLEWVVFLFFVLSGYLIGRPFMLAIIEQRRMPRLSKYATRRLLRILPAFWLAWTATLIIQQPQDSFLNIMSTYAMAQIYTLAPSSYELSQAWTVDIEIAFYLGLPLTVLGANLLLRRVRTPAHRAAILLAILGVVFLASAYLRGMKPDDLVWTWNPATLMWSFVPGLALAILEPFWADRLAGRRLGRVIAWAGFAIAVLGIVWSAALHHQEYHWMAVATTMATGGLMVGALVWQWTTGGCWKIIDNRFCNWMGERSYSLYLLHVLVLANLFPLVDGMENVKLAWFALMAMGVPACLLAAHLSYRFVEKPFMGANVSLKPLTARFSRAARAPARP